MRLSVIALFLVITTPIFAGEESFGRLFTSSEQRIKLNSIRKKIGLNDTLPLENNPNSAKNVATVAKEIQLSGYISRHNGIAMVWLNGQSELSGSHQDLPKATNSRADGARITVHSNGKTRTLKPGQVWLLENNLIQESYQKKWDATPAPPRNSQVEND